MKRFIFILLLLFLHAAFPLSSDAITLKSEISKDSKLNEPGVVGLNLEIRSGTPTKIITVYPGTPADEAGLQSGDTILSINQWPTTGLSKAQVNEAIPDVPGSEVRFLIQRSGRTFSVTITVAPISAIGPSKSRSILQQALP